MAQLTAIDEAVVGRGKDETHGRGLDEREVGRLGNGLHGGQEGILSVRALAADAEAVEEDLVADGYVTHVVGDRGDHAGSVRADRLGRLFGRGEAVLAHRHVERVDAGRRDANQDLAGAGRRRVDLLVDQNLRATVAVDPHCLHSLLLVCDIESGSSPTRTVARLGRPKRATGAVAAALPTAGAGGVLRTRAAPQTAAGAGGRRSAATRGG